MLTAIYKSMPNDTDLMVFKGRGVPGVNFAFIGGVWVEHSNLTRLLRATDGVFLRLNLLLLLFVTFLPFTTSLMATGLGLYVATHPKIRRFHLFGRIHRVDGARLTEIFRIGTPIALTLAFEVSVFSAAVYLMGWIDTDSGGFTPPTS